MLSPYSKIGDSDFNANSLDDNYVEDSSPELESESTMKMDPESADPPDVDGKMSFQQRAFSV